MKKFLISMLFILSGCGNNMADYKCTKEQFEAVKDQTEFCAKPELFNDKFLCYPDAIRRNCERK